MAAKKKTPEKGAPKAVNTASFAEPEKDLHKPPVEPATPEHAFDDAAADASADDAIAVVKRTPEGKQEALIQVWIARRNAAAIADIAERNDAPAVARKAARRALGILKSRGVVIPERKGKVVSLVAKPTFTFEARMLFPDTRGVQMWWIAKVASTGATTVIEVTTADRQGILQINRGNPSAGNLRQVYQGWQARVGRAPTDVPVEWARHRIAAARKLNDKSKALVPIEFDGASELLLPREKAPPPHPIEGEDLAIPSEEEAVRARLGKTMHLHEEPEFGTWLPDDNVGVEVISTINQRILALGDEVLKARDQEKIDAVVNGAIEEAADAYFNEERKALYASRFRDAAWSLYRAGLIDRAIDTVIVAAAIQRAGIVSDRPSEIGFVRGLFVKLLAVAQQRATAMQPRGNEEGARLA